MQWIKSEIENPSKSEVVGRCGGDKKKRMTTQNRQKSNAKKKGSTENHFWKSKAACLPNYRHLSSKNINKLGVSSKNEHSRIQRSLYGEPIIQVILSPEL